ncbi:hypothetical protein H6G97_25755 [Nostoc flagelliforme FACHB-838]|uniref:Uncharacterized protein n=1 Tax=Nostoc flagelliforme FACHB-838 TaxID=2692904 RepID=A0ABR8DVA1_9NOSO|nr:hypothetical protein [Nostoc flagelliforme FACHB-838]
MKKVYLLSQIELNLRLLNAKRLLHEGYEQLHPESLPELLQKLLDILLRIRAVHLNELLL